MVPVSRALGPRIGRETVDILIGSNCCSALEPLETVSDPECPLLAVKLRHGWTVLGSQLHSANDESCFRVVHKEIMCPQDFTHMFEAELNECKVSCPEERSPSLNDKKLLEFDESVHFVDGHFCVPLPLKDPKMMLPNNRLQAFQRLLRQSKKMKKNDRVIPS